MAYELAQKDYLVTDLLALDGQHFSQYIETDLRQIAIDNGYPISIEPGAEDELDWADRTVCRISLVEEGDGTRIYRSTLESYGEMVKAG